MSSSAYSKLEGIKADLIAQGVEIDNISDLLLLILAEMRSQHVKVAYGMGAGGTALGVVVALLIPILVLH